MFQFAGGAITDVGLRRSSNQDSYLYSEELGLYVVADGMGGHSGGEMASRIAVETLKSFYTEHASKTLLTLDPLAEVDLLRQAVEAANRAIYEHAQVHAELRGMGTTLVCLRVRGQTGFVAHVGDSRLYRIDAGGLRRVTKDHSRVQELIDAKQLTEIEAQSILGRNIITRALGNRPHVEVDTQILDMRQDEGYMLCSDGLCGVLNDQETFAVCRSATTLPPDPQPVMTALVDRVKQNGAPDNVTVVLLLGNRFGEPRPKGAPELGEFDLYPDTQRILTKEGEALDDEPKEETKPMILAQPQGVEAGRMGALDPGEEVLNRGSAETMAHLETLVQSVAASRGAAPPGENGSDAAQALAPGQAGSDEQDSTLKLSLGEIQQARAATAPKFEEEDSTPRMPRQPLAKPEHAAAVEAAPARRSRLPLVAGLLAVPLLLIGFLLFGPQRSKHLVIELQAGGNVLQVLQVGMPVGGDLGRTLLEGPVGGILASMRANGRHELSLPEAVPEDVWKVLHDCPSCGVLGAGGKLVETGDGSVDGFAARLYGSLGDHYRDKKRHETARLFYSAGKKALGEADANVRIARDYYIEGIQLQENKNFAGALENFSRALDLGGVEPDLEERLASAAFEQCKALLEAGKGQEAQAAYDLARKHGFPAKAELEQLLEKAAAQPTPAGLDPKIEVAPPPLPELAPAAPDEGAGKEVIDDPFAERQPKPTPEKGKEPRAPLPVVEYENQGSSPTPGKPDSREP